MLCVEGIARAIKTYLGLEKAPTAYSISAPAVMQEILVKVEVLYLDCNLMRIRYRQSKFVPLLLGLFCETLPLTRSATMDLSSFKINCTTISAGRLLKV